MPISFYNTAPPTPTTKNNITDIAVTYGIRDFLLNKNLAPVYPFISTSINGSPRIGEPVLDTSINANSNVTPFGLPLETEGLLRYDVAILPNIFKNDDPSAPLLLNVDDITKTQGIFGNVDFPQGTQSYPTSSNQGVADYGLLGKTKYAGFRKNATLYNLYLDSTKQIDVADFITLQPVGFTQQITGYLDQYGGLNLGDNEGGIQAANIIGSVLNGQGLGLSKGGVVPNFDIRSSLAGRVLGGIGAIHDTKLGTIGAQQLALALANNAAFNIQQDILGSLNVQDNILALVKGGPLPGFRPDYKITVPSSTGGKIADYTERILGFTIPRSYLQDDGSIFSSENQSGNIQRANAMLANTGKGQRQALIANMFANINGTGHYDNPTSTAFRSGYVPGHAKGESKPDLNPTLYAFYDDATKGTILNFMAHSSGATDLIPKISYDRSNMIKAYGFLTPEETYTGPGGNGGYNDRKSSDIGFTWVGIDGTVNAYADVNSRLPLNNKKSLLTKTQKLFNSKGMLNMVSVKGDIGHSSSQIETSNGNGFSKGSAVLSSDYTFGGIVAYTADNTYCRSWTTLDRYDKVSKLVRNTGLKKVSDVYKAANAYRFQYENSTLESEGFVKIAPYGDDNFTLDYKTAPDPKNYMFSIENLAWNDNTQNLLPVEQGPGDLTTGTRGRIMWFPPYNIRFSESSSVNWESTNFIGRGEPIYTYNNTERSGNLSFSVIVDHSSYINSFADNNIIDNNYVASFVAGCIEPNIEIAKKLTVSQKSFISNSLNNTTAKKTVEPFNVPNEMKFNIYYPNDNYDVKNLGNFENGLKNGSSTPFTPIDYEANSDGSGYGIGEYSGAITKPRDKNGNPTNNPFKVYIDNTNFGLNASNRYVNGVQYSGVSFDSYLDDYYTALQDFLENTCKECIIKITSYASEQGYDNDNVKLADARTNSAFGYLKSKLQKIDSKRIRPTLPSPTQEKNSTCTNQSIDSTDCGDCKERRKTEITFDTDENLLPKSITDAPINVKTSTGRETINQQVTSQLYDESNYFNRLTQKDPLVFDVFREKIKYFHPAFHSMTPEGLNSRLTFLQQCTRQGPTLENTGTKNLAFGRPPVCILRIGDFYHTKVVIDNLSIEYEPLVWDLNPEGIGVQPMIANVNLSFKFLGGSSLQGPINILQNALSFNYYANTHVYDPRANYLVKKQNAVTNNNGKETATYDIKGGTKNLDNYLKITNIPPSTVEKDQIATATNNDSNSAKPTAGAATNTTGSDENIYFNALSFKKYNLSISYEGTKLKGRFFIYGDNNLLTKEHDAKIQLSAGPMGGMIDIATFKLGGPSSNSPGGGNFISTKDGWKEALSLASDNATKTVYFKIIIPEFSKISFWERMVVMPYDCPYQEHALYDIINEDDYNIINENPCCNCYPSPYTAKSPYIINGTKCPLSGTTC